MDRRTFLKATFPNYVAQKCRPKNLLFSFVFYCSAGELGFIEGDVAFLYAKADIL